MSITLTEWWGELEQAFADAELSQLKVNGETITLANQQALNAEAVRLYREMATEGKKLEERNQADTAFKFGLTQLPPIETAIKAREASLIAQGLIEPIDISVGTETRRQLHPVINDTASLLFAIITYEQALQFQEIESSRSEVQNGFSIFTSKAIKNVKPFIAENARQLKTKIANYIGQNTTSLTDEIGRDALATIIQRFDPLEEKVRTLLKTNLQQVLTGAQDIGEAENPLDEFLAVRRLQQVHDQIRQHRLAMEETAKLVELRQEIEARMNAEASESYFTNFLKPQDESYRNHPILAPLFANMPGSDDEKAAFNTTLVGWYNSNKRYATDTAATVAEPVANIISQATSTVAGWLNRATLGVGGRLVKKVTESSTVSAATGAISELVGNAQQQFGLKREATHPGYRCILAKIDQTIDHVASTRLAAPGHIAPQQAITGDDLRSKSPETLRNVSKKLALIESLTSINEQLSEYKEQHRTGLAKVSSWGVFGWISNQMAASKFTLLHRILEDRLIFFYEVDKLRKEIEALKGEIDNGNFVEKAGIAKDKLSAVNTRATAVVRQSLYTKVFTFWRGTNIKAKTDLEVVTTCAQEALDTSIENNLDQRQAPAVF